MLAACKANVKEAYHEGVRKSHKLEAPRVELKHPTNLDQSNVDLPLMEASYVDSREKALGVDRASVLFSKELENEDLSNPRSKLKALAARLAKFQS